MVYIFTFIFTLMDQIIKIIINKSFIVGESKTIIENFFSITNAHNFGAAWSILTDKGYLLIAVAILVIGFIYRFFIYKKKLTKIDSLLLGMLLAGILGNMIDRIFLGYVVDYLDFVIFGYDYPIFNLADTLIVISTIILLIKDFKEEKNGKIPS